MEKLLTIKQAADLLNLKTPTIYKKTSNKSIPFIKIGGKLLFKASVLEKWVNQHTVETLN